MKRILPYLALIPLVFLALTPPLEMQLDCTINSTFWLWATFISGFFAFLLLYQKISIFLKLFVVWCFASCFVSKAPYMSFTMFWSLTICAWYYVLCTKIDDWRPIKKAIQAIFFFITLLVIMQLFGKDTLLNFTHKANPLVFGTIGNKMISSSFSCVLAPFLLFNPLNWVVLGLITLASGSSGAILSIGVGLVVYAFFKFKKIRIPFIVLVILASGLFAYKTGDITTFMSKAGRRLVYMRTFELSLERPQGYGIGTYKMLFPVMCGREINKQEPDRQWSTCHNDWLQILFETGFPGIILLLGWLISIVRRVKDPIKLAGLAILATNMAIHFPTRMVQSAFIILMFLAYCSQTKKDDKEYEIEGGTSGYSY